MKFKPISEIKIFLCFDENPIFVGRMAVVHNNHNNKRGGFTIYFAYDGDFIKKGLDISPFKCPLIPNLQKFDPYLFDGLAGVFNDSLPDGWGRLLLDRQIRKSGIEPAQLSALDRLAYAGSNAMGALVYKPDYYAENNIYNSAVDIEELAGRAKQVLQGEGANILSEMLALNGSSAGARPKALIGLHKNRQNVIYGMHNMPEDYQHWLVKFANIGDGADAGAVEYVYSLMAKRAGLLMPDVHLFPARSGGGAGYFAVKRFDREGNNRLHMHSVCGLLHSDFRTPCLDYRDILALTHSLTKDIREVEKIYRLAVFNILAHNRDDHSKNFSFLMDKKGQWKNSPPYDLTFSSGPCGEQSTMLLGEGKNPGIEGLINLGLKAKIAKTTIHAIIEQTKEALNEWPSLASQFGVSRANIEFIASKINHAIKK